jgi:ATP-binding cassette subfamily F protein 3
VLPARARAARAALDAATAALGSGTEAALAAFAAAEEAYASGGGYDLEARAASVLGGLGVDADAAADRLSGGQARRALLARLLLEPADFYLLDEPTNHLDLDAVRWLEGWVRASPAAFLIVSHDRAFLDATVGRVLELERGALREYPGTYTAAMAVKRAERERQRVEYANHQRQVKQLTADARRLSQEASNAGHFDIRKAKTQEKLSAKNKAEDVSRTLARRARSLEARLGRLEDVQKPFEDREVTRVPLPESDRGPREVLNLEGARLERGGRVVLDGVTLHLRRGERVALVGPNGGGKSTLLAAAAGDLEPSAGTLRRGLGLRLYRSGQHGEELLGSSTLMDALQDADPSTRRATAFSLLASLGLPRDPALPVGALSGGERTRLSLARLALTRAHLLLLDEPTNHLDTVAVEALEAMLAGFEGTVLFASHDRRLVATVATRVLRVQGGRVVEEAVVDA